MPCPSAPTTCTVTLPLRKSIGAVRRDLASEKNGHAIRSWASRGAKPPGSARNRASGALPESSDTTHARSEEHTSELQSLMRISYAVFCLKKKKHTQNAQRHTTQM